ncbi:MAG: hypothetical protein PHT54_02325 [Candidatus Nanoarchaeia archaeon]|nr:hypothetical protein [Candidatus Nanoarchaeia archaeon]
MANFEKDIKEIKLISNPFERLERLNSLLKQEIEKEEEKKVWKEIEETNKEIFLRFKPWTKKDGLNVETLSKTTAIEENKIPNLEHVVREEDVRVENPSGIKGVDYGKPFNVNGIYQPNMLNEPKKEETEFGYQPKINDAVLDEQKKKEEELKKYID